MAERGRINRRHLDLEAAYIDAENYFYRKDARPRGCKCIHLWNLLPTRFGFMTKSNSSFWENMVKVDIFSWGEVEALVRGMNTSLVESILDCDCPACQKVQFLENIKTAERKEKVISDMQLFSDIDKGASLARNAPPKDIGRGGSKPVLFAMLCYLGTPFMIYFDIWENSSREPGKLGLMRFHLAQDHVFECFRRLYALQPMVEGGLNGSAISKGTVIDKRTNKFIKAFQQVERQFQPLQLSPRIESLTVPKDAVFPFQDFEYRQRGGQGGIYVAKVLEEFREGLKKGHSTDDETFVCKVIEIGRSTGQECTVGEAADHEKYGISRMKELGHPSLIQMHLWFDFLNTRVFLLPCYHGDLDGLLRGTFGYSDFNPPRPLSPGTTCRGSSYIFPTKGWLWKGMLGILDGLAHFHGSAANQGVQATHLDLKPSNILISRAGEMVISDCGTSRVTHEYRTHLTTTQFVGTTAYSPPWTERETELSNPQPKLNQTFDVWSMACILLEVLIFIMQGEGGIERFRKDKQKTDMDGGEVMNSTSPRSTFWYFESRKQNTFKMKRIVCEWLGRADAMAKLTENNTGTLSRLATRLRIMFKVNPSERGTIEDCLRHLREDQVPGIPLALDSHVDIELDLEEMIEILHGNSSSLFGGDELGYIDGSYQACRGILRTVSNLSLRYLRGNEECPCRIRIFENQPRGIVSISIAFVFRGKIVLENITLQRKLDSLFQKNLFDVQRQRQGSVTATGVIWGFTGLHQSQLFKTKDLMSFMVIQEILLGQEYIPGSYSQLDVCVLKPWTGVFERAAEPITVYLARVEVWIEVPESQKPWLKRVGAARSTDALSATSSYGSGRSGGGGFSRNSSQPQHAGKAIISVTSGVELGHNPRLVIYRRYQNTGMIDCITIKCEDKPSFGQLSTSISIVRK
ncbi:kinase-like domain-containing protein [Tirmania nivea]|nr:kinase-like domain-containing protein [Tirmania nivea]